MKKSVLLLWILFFYPVWGQESNPGFRFERVEKVPAKTLHISNKGNTEAPVSGQETGICKDKAKTGTLDSWRLFRHEFRRLYHSECISPGGI